MLNLKFNVEVQKISYPITFHKKNTCVHCGADNSLVFVDIFGNESEKEIHSFDHIRCKNCGRNFSICWVKEEESSKMYPTAVEPGIKQEFFNIANIAKIKSNGVKEF